MYQTLRKKHREKHLHQAGAVKHPGITCSASRVISEHQLITDLEIKIFFWMNSGNCCSYKSHEARWHFWRWILQGHRAKHQQKGMSVAGVKILPVTPLPCSWPAILTTWRIFFSLGIKAHQRQTDMALFLMRSLNSNCFLKKCIICSLAENCYSYAS